MTLPGDLYSVVVTGSFRDAGGVGIPGAITFTPAVTLTDSTGNVVIPAVGKRYTLTGGTLLTDPLVASDNADLSPGGSTYTVKVELQNLPPSSYSVQLLAAPFAFTATNATPCVFTATGSTYANGTQVALAGSAPAGFTSGTTYFVVSASGTAFSLAATSGGSAIASTGTGSGFVYTSVTDISDLQPVSVSGTPSTYLTLSGGILSGTLTLNGSPALKIPSGAGSGDVLTSDGSGNAAWAATAQLLTPTAVKTTTYTAAAGNMVLCDTQTTGAFTVTLPAAPADKTTIGVKMVKQASTNAVTIARGGSDTFNDDGSTSASLALLNQSAIFQYDAALTAWIKTSSDTPLAQLDARYAQVAGATMTGALVTQVPNIVFDGDSLTNGTGALPYNNFPNGNDYPSQVAGTLNHAGTFYNVGVGGEQTSTMITNAPTVVDAKLVAGGNNIVCFHGGTNDIFYTDNATTSYNRIVTYCQARQAAGWKVIVGTLTPRSDAGTPGDFDTVRLSVNTSIRANWATFANGLADIGADANMGTSGQELNTQYYNGDNVHHNPTGYRVLAGYYLAALAKLGVAGHQHGDKSGLTSDLWIPPADFALTSGSPTLVSVDNNVAWQLNHSSTDVVCTSVKIPQDWLSFSTQIYWTQSAGGSGNVAWRADLQPVLSGTNLTLGDVAGAQTNTAVPSGNIVAVTTLRGSDNVQNGGYPSRGVFNLRAVRLGSTGGDTYTSGALLLGAYLYRAT